jgi:hypothetical protein
MSLRTFASSLGWPGPRDIRKVNEAVCQLAKEILGGPPPAERPLILAPRNRTGLPAWGHGCDGAKGGRHRRLAPGARTFGACSPPRESPRAAPHSEADLAPFLALTFEDLPHGALGRLARRLMASVPSRCTPFTTARQGRTGSSPSAPGPPRQPPSLGPARAGSLGVAGSRSR